MPENDVLSALKAHEQVNRRWLALRQEPIVDPELPIIDPHHHVWDMPGNRYLFDELTADIYSGHNVTATVHVACHSMHRCEGPPEFAPVGETEFINGVAAQAASGAYGSTSICAGIVGTTDLMLGGGVEPVLEAHLRAGGSRFRGIRPTVASHESSLIRPQSLPPHILLEAKAREAIGAIAQYGLTLDLWLFFTQLEDAMDVCERFPDLPVIVNHVGGPLAIGPYEGQREVMFATWRKKIIALARHSNARMKLGGLAMRYAGFDYQMAALPPSSDQMASDWAPYIETCIEAFGPQRCMFESNFPVDAARCSYHILWNAFKKLAHGCSDTERRQLFHDTAAATYRLEPATVAPSPGGTTL